MSFSFFRKWTGRALLLLLFLQCVLPPVQAFSQEGPDFSAGMDPPTFAEGQAPGKEAPSPDSSPAAKKSPDEAFVERSKRAEKFVFTDLPRHLGYDLKESFWGFGSLGLGIGLAMTAALHEQDHDIQSSFEPHALFGETGDDVFKFMGNPLTMGGVGVVTAMVGGFGHNEKLATTGESILEALFWTQLFTYGIKVAADRERPDGTSLSFPSAHASGVFSTATVFQVMYGPKVGVPMYAFASAVALSRVDSFKHFPSDVLMGAVLGSVIGFGTARYHKKLHRNFGLSPDLAKDYYGLRFRTGF